MNHAKYCLFFNAGEDNQLKREVAGALGIQQVSNSGHYLGLPTVRGRSRKESLNYLKERIQDKMHGWQNRLLNNARKEVLIKSVITSIPTYAMNVF